MFVAHEVDSLEPGMIIDDNKGVSASAINGRLEWSSDVNMYESTRVRRAGSAGWRVSMTEAARRVAGELSKSLEVSPPAV
eukprot:2344338-Pleurochrysis_carterae.AAC.1